MILYFSGTGNSKYCAEKIASKTGSELRSINNIRIAIPWQCKATKNFRVNDNCIGCGLCETVCPRNLIRLQDGKPVWIKDDYS